MKKKIIIVGGGAAGIVAAITAANHGAEVTILEHKDKIGSKLLLTGNGKCNLTNFSMGLSDYCFTEEEAKRFLERMSETVPPNRISDFFRTLGMRTVVLRGSYVYPETEAASTVVSVFLRELKRLAVDIRTGIHVQAVYEEDQRLCIETSAERFYADEVILACGGASYPKTGSDGSGFSLLKSLDLKTVSPYPALTALVCSNTGQKTLSGLRQNAVVKLYFRGNEIAGEYGQIQFTDYGISGIPVFCVSSCLIPELFRQASLKDGIDSGNFEYSDLFQINRDSILAKIDLFPDSDADEVADILCKQAEVYGDFPFEEAFNGILHKKWLQYLSRKFSFSGKKSAQLKKEDFMLLARELKGVKFPVTDMKGFDFCQVTGGGLSFQEITEDFSLKKYPHIRVVGELLNLTGKCGGYNLHWAFASGLIAGEAAAK